jgi:glutamine amidotransferase
LDEGTRTAKDLSGLAPGHPRRSPFDPFPERVARLVECKARRERRRQIVTSMCQLLGMNCNVPTDICFSFQGFSARGGGTDVHADGWGIAFFEGRGCRVFLDSHPAQVSPVAELVRRYPIKSTNVIAHIRKATQGSVALENCHPFQRELWGRYWVFAHNGNLEPAASPPPRAYRPVGDTDSEAAFCAILDVLRDRFPSRKPPLPVLLAALAEHTDLLRRRGPFNYLLSDGEQLFAHAATQLHYVVRQAPFAQAHLVDQDLTVDFAELTTPDDRVAVIATTPLTDNEAWTAIPLGRVVAFQDGAPLEAS